MEFFNVARVPCQHEYCRPCLEQLFRLAMTDESLYPPRCCQQVIPIGQIRFFLTPDVAKEFEEKTNELDTQNRTYCHAPTCSTFIPIHNIANEVGTCPKCSRTTCVTCKTPSHRGDCFRDEALQQLLVTATSKEWQRCYACERVVELETGCNYIT